MARYSSSSLRLLAVCYALVPSMTQAQPADCFNSTFDFLVAQATDPRPNSERRVYEFCPDQIIQVGLPSDATFTDFVNGDFPLGIIRPNLTIEGNGLTLVGGVYQLASLPVFLFGETTFADVKEDVIINNVVFQGPLTPLPSFGANSIFLAGPGHVTLHQIVAQDFEFADGTCGSNALYAGATTLEGLTELTPPGSVRVTVHDSIFQNSAMSNCTGLISVVGQNLELNSVLFNNIDAFSLISTTGEQATVTVENVCVTDSTFTAAPFGMSEYGNQTAFASVSGLYLQNIENEDCMGVTNLWLNPIAGDGEYSCGTLDTVDTCYDDTMTRPPAPTAMPSGGSMTTATPSDGLEVTDAPNGSESTDAPNGSESTDAPNDPDSAANPSSIWAMGSLIATVMILSM